GRLVGEGHGQARSRQHAALEESRDAVRDDAGLAGACPGEHQHRPEVVLDGCTLRRIQIHRAAGFTPGPRNWGACFCPGYEFSAPRPSVASTASPNDWGTKVFTAPTK